MKSIYYNWTKPRFTQNQLIISNTEEVWGQFVDLEINDNNNININTNTNNLLKKYQYCTLIKYEPSLFTIQENVARIYHHKFIIYYVASSSTFIMSMSFLGFYVIIHMLIDCIMVYKNNQV